MRPFGKLLQEKLAGMKELHCEGAVSRWSRSGPLFPVRVRRVLKEIKVWILGEKWRRRRTKWVKLHTSSLDQGSKRTLQPHDVRANELSAAAVSSHSCVVFLIMRSRVRIMYNVHAFALLHAKCEQQAVGITRPVWGEVIEWKLQHGHLRD